MKERRESRTSCRARKALTRCEGTGEGASLTVIIPDRTMHFGKLHGARKSNPVSLA
jgi:hypothetical protein